MAMRWGIRWTIGAGLALIVAAALFFAVSGAGRTDLSSTDKINRASAGRVSLVTGGYDLARDRPIWGWGSGSFGQAFKDEVDEKARTTVSHSEPLTVGAEQGAIGLVVYGALVVLGLLVLLGGGARESLAATAVAACFVALIVHSLGYADFSVDPAMWALLGVGVALRIRRTAGAELPAPDRAGRPASRDPRPANA
jgi:O-antigen ligase